METGGGKPSQKPLLGSHVSFSCVESWLRSWLCPICHVGTTFPCCSLVFRLTQGQEWLEVAWRVFVSRLQTPRADNRAASCDDACSICHPLTLYSGLAGLEGDTSIITKMSRSGDFG